MLINKYLDENLFENFDEEKEKKKFEVIKFIKDLFEDKIIINEKTSDIFLEKLKYKFVHKATFIVLSNLRAKSKLLKSKSLIDLLGKEFIIIAEYSIKNKIYDIIQNCIIISQTYYYEDENENKIYIVEHLKNNGCLKNTRFWRDFIEAMIKEDFNRLENNFTYWFITIYFFFI